MMRRAICSNQSPICVITDAAAAAAAVCFLSGKLDGKAEEETLLFRRRGVGGGCNVICEETGLFLDDPFCPRLFFFFLFLVIFILLPARNKYQKQSRAEHKKERKILRRIIVPAHPFLLK